jgi:hypothetical protein
MQRLYTTMLIAALACSCVKTSLTGNNLTGNNSTGNSDTSAAITAIGTPIGSPVTKTIGAAGGTIISADGRAELNIPAGALSSDLAISIQPITNECPNGVGVAYDFLPNSTRFLIPATFTLHYTDDDINGTDPYLLNLAFQDSLNEWEVDIFKDVDTVGKTIIFDISHFSSRAVQADAKIGPAVKISSISGTDFTESQQGVLVVSQGARPSQIAGSVDGDPDQLLTLPTPIAISDDKVSNWTLSAGSQNGILSPTSGSVDTYTAPNTILQEKTVTVFATVSINAVSVDRLRHKSRVGSGPEVLRLKLHLHPTNMSFSIKVIFNTSDASGYKQDKYHDEATFEVDVKNYLVSMPKDKIQNSAPSVTPASFVSGTTQVDWQSDQYGVINVTGGSGYTTLDSLNFNQRDVALLITHSNTVTPTFKTTDLPTGNVSYVQGSSVPGYPQAIDFIYKDSVQVIDPEKGNILEGLMTVTITPIH